MKFYKFLSLSLLLLSLSILFIACPFFPEPGDGNLKFDVLWEAPMYSVHNSYASILHENTLYVQQGSGMIAVDITDGHELWRTVGSDKVSPYSEMLLIDDYLLFVGISYGEDGKLRRDLWLMNRHTGSLVGRNKLVCPDFIPVAEWDYYFYQYDWIESYGNRIIMPIMKMMDPGHFAHLGVYEFDFNPALFTMDDDKEPIELECVYKFKERQDGQVRPIIENNIMYQYVCGSGWRGALPEGDELEDGFYYQKDVHVVAIDLVTNTVLWKVNLNICGWASSHEHLLLEDQILYIADYRGRAAIDTQNASLLYEYSGGTMGYSAYDDGILYYPFVDATLRAYRPSDGKLLWEHQPEEYIHNRETNPLFHGDRVYMVDPEGLRAYNKKTGKYYGLQESLGAPGNRIPGYIPFKDDIIYIPQTTRLLAVRLGSER